MRLASSCAPSALHFRPLHEARPRPAEVLLRHLLEQAVAGPFTISGTELWTVSRGRRRAIAARQVAMYLAHVQFGLNLTQVGRLCARDRTTVAHTCAIIEDRREDPGFDHALVLFEGVLRALSRASPLSSGDAA
jgi:Bacterial dnaA protein helix-turn-helix